MISCQEPDNDPLVMANGSYVSFHALSTWMLTALDVVASYIVLWM